MHIFSSISKGFTNDHRIGRNRICF